MSVVFSKDTTYIAIQNPERGNTKGSDLRQVMGRSAAGSPYTYQKGTELRDFTLAWSNLRESEADDLYYFFRMIAAGMMYSFAYTDHKGVLRTCKFAQPDIFFREIDDEEYLKTVFNSQSNIYPTTVRQKSVFATEVRLLVIAGLTSG